MNEIFIKSYAKINLSLDVLGILPNGYHQVEMVMQQLELHDLVTVRWTECESHIKMRSKIILTTNRTDLPLNSENIAYKAAGIMLEHVNKAGTVEIHIEKNIPVAAGLAGGSGNGAAVLHALNYLLKCRMSVSELCHIGLKLGADVPFCIMGQAKGNMQLGKHIYNDKLACTCALAEGIGEKLTPIPPLKCEVLLSKPNIGVSTKEVYKGIDAELGFKRPEMGIKSDEMKHHINTKELIEGLKMQNYDKVISNMSNVLEFFSVKRYPIIVYTKDKIREEGHSSKILMSGSGPTVFAIYLEKLKIEDDYEILCKFNKETYMTKTLIVNN